MIKNYTHFCLKQKAHKYIKSQKKITLSSHNIAFYFIHSIVRVLSILFSKRIAC